MHWRILTSARSRNFRRSLELLDSLAQLVHSRLEILSDYRTSGLQGLLQLIKSGRQVTVADNLPQLLAELRDIVAALLLFCGANAGIDDFPPCRGIDQVVSQLAERRFQQDLLTIERKGEGDFWSQPWHHRHPSEDLFPVSDHEHLHRCRPRRDDDDAATVAVTDRDQSRWCIARQ